MIPNLNILSLVLFFEHRPLDLFLYCIGFENPHKSISVKNLMNNKSPTYDTWNNTQERQYPSTNKTFLGLGGNPDNGGYSGGADDFLAGVTVGQSDINIRMGI